MAVKIFVAHIFIASGIGVVLVGDGKPWLYAALVGFLWPLVIPLYIYSGAKSVWERISKRA